MHALRKLDLHKAPSIAETLDWARALRALQIRELNAAAVRQTLNLVLKHEEDLRKADAKLGALLASATKDLKKNSHGVTEKRRGFRLAGALGFSVAPCES